MKKVKIITKTVIGLSIMIFFVFTGCTNKLTAKFESDTVGGLPDRTLPGSPGGDELDYVPELETQLKVIATPSDASKKSLEYRSVAPSGEVSATNLWIGFQATSTNFAKPITFLWSGRKDFSSGGSHMLIDCTDGSGTMASRIRLQNNGDVVLISNLLTGDGVNIGTIPNNEVHTFMITVDLSNRVYSVSVLKNSGTLSRNGHPILTQDVLLFHNPAKPTVSFRFENFYGSQKYIIDEVFINRKN